MGYIGVDINYGNIAKQVATSSGSTTPTGALIYTVPTSESIMVTLDGVTQVPGTDFNVTGGTVLTFTTLVPADVVVLVYFLGKSLDIGTPADNTVDSAQLVAGSVDDAHLATGITASKLSGVVPAANLGTGTASSSTILYGDGTYKTEPVSAPYIAWQAVVTASTLTAVAGRGYPINTTSNACTITLPASASVGDTIKITDYLRTWATNYVTINQNSLKFQGNTTPNPAFSTNGQTVTFTYVDVTQGWLPTVDDDVPYLTAPTISASGGDATDTYTYDSIDYKWHKFTSDGDTDFVITTVPAGKTIDVLVIGGGGGGSSGVYGTSNGGGGGAGGLRWLTAQTPTASTYVATVGGGGAGGSSGIAADGEDSTFIGSGISITGTGGGNGGYNNAANAGDGGSGGGATGTYAVGAGNTPSTTPVQGYSGGTSNTGSAGGGGGGSGGVGQNNVGEAGTTAHGGVGEDNFLNQSSAAFTVAATKALLDSVALGEVDGSSRHIAGGGGGGGQGLTNGGLGGGGDGLASFGAGTAGTVNTGSGGGGCSHSTTAGGSGGSGVVIVRYLA